MGELYKYSIIAGLASEIFTSNQERLNWIECLDKANEIYERGVDDGIKLDGASVINSEKENC